MPTPSTIMFARVIRRRKSSEARARGDLLLRAADQEEPGEVAAVRLEQHDLERLDRARLLLRAPVLDRLVEDAQPHGLAPADRCAPSDEQACLGHRGLLSVDLPSLCRARLRVKLRAMRLGRIGIWRRYQPGPGIVPELEALGYGALWLGSSPSLDDARAYLEASEEITIATGILNIWQHDPADVASAAPAS